MTELEYRIAFSRIKGMNLEFGKELLRRAGSEKAFFDASDSERAKMLHDCPRLKDSVNINFLEESARKEAEFVNSHNITAIYFSDKNYPLRLLNCEDAPLILYGLGKCDLNAAHIIGIVGTRHATPYGISFVNKLIEDLNRKLDNLVIVSGLAYGIDIAAHRAALSCDVPTVAVFGHGLSTVYPASHRTDAASMIKHGGMVLTEYPHDTKIKPPFFLARNRIIAGLSDCIVVAESAARGGSLVTAGIASGYGRDVFALPGRTSDLYSQGCNALIASNAAALVSNADDLIAAMGWSSRAQEGDQQELQLELTPEEQPVYEYISRLGEAQINDMTAALAINIGKLSSLLINMEFNGLILSFPGGYYRLA